MTAPATAVRSAVEAEAPETFTEASELYAGDLPAMAAAIAGTTDKRSREYRAALRNLQRYRQGTRRPSTRTLERMRRVSTPLARRRRLSDIRANGFTASLAALVRVSADERFRQIDAQYVPPEALGRFVDAAERGRWGAAADAFGAAFFNAYGIGAGATLLDVDSLNIESG